MAEVRHTGNIQPSLDLEEHDHLEGGVPVKKVGNYIWTGDDWERKVDYQFSGPVTTTISADGNTITETDGVRTKTTVISNGGNTITESWS